MYLIHKPQFFKCKKLQINRTNLHTPRQLTELQGIILLIYTCSQGRLLLGEITVSKLCATPGEDDRNGATEGHFITT